MSSSLVSTPLSYEVPNFTEFSIFSGSSYFDQTDNSSAQTDRSIQSPFQLDSRLTIQPFKEIKPTALACLENRVVPTLPTKCYFFSIGGCRYGDECRFLHELILPDVPVKANSPEVQGTISEPLPPHSPILKSKPSEVTTKKVADLFKTERCRNFEVHGKCDYRGKCRFAHDEPLRERSYHPKFKTTFCVNFSSEGYCRYERKCHFIHSDPTKE